MLGLSGVTFRNDYCACCEAPVTTSICEEALGRSATQTAPKDDRQARTKLQDLSEDSVGCSCFTQTNFKKGLSIQAFLNVCCKKVSPPYFGAVEGRIWDAVFPQNGLQSLFMVLGVAWGFGT